MKEKVVNKYVIIYIIYKKKTKTYEFMLGILSDF